jgi:uncharacterized protein
VNVAHPPLGDRGLDSLRRAQEAHESSMDEILASIRSIIEDDCEPGAADVRAPHPVAAEGPQVVYSNDSIASARTIVRTPNAASFASDSPGESSRPIPRVVWQAPRPRTASPFASAPGLNALGVEEEPLVSAASDAALESAFNALSASIAMQNSGRIETMTREVLRPLLKTWLDDNLPGLADRLVRAEIQRIARGGR